MTCDPVITAELDTPINDLLKVMVNQNIIRIPIIDKGQIVGVVARCDVLKALIEPEFVTYALGTRRFWRGLVPTGAA
jgi:predicted transcriptional regulator